MGDGVSSGAGDLFFFGEPAAGGVGDGVGVGDFFFAAVVVFFLRCGVGVGAEKIFLRACPRVCSAASLAGAARKAHIKQMKTRRSM